MGFQPVIAQTRDVQVAATGAFAVFVPNRLGCGVVQQMGVFGAAQHLGQSLAQVCCNNPVGACLTRCCHGGAHSADAPLAVGHRTFFLAPCGGGQQQVGVVAGGSRGKCFLHHHKLGTLQSAAHRFLVRHGLRGVGTSDPHGFDLPVGSSFEHLDSGEARFSGYMGHPPERSNFSAVLWVCQIAVRRHQVGHAADFPPAHGIGLTRQRQRSCTRATDLLGGQMQVDQGGIFGRAVARLVQALAIKAEGRAALSTALLYTGKPASCGVKISLEHAANLSHVLRRMVGHQSLQSFKATGVSSNVGGLRPALGQHDVQQTMKEHHISAGLNGQMQVSHVGCIGAARVNHDHFERRVGAFGVFDTAKQNWVCPGRIAARNEQALRVSNVLVASGWCVGT